MDNRFEVRRWGPGMMSGSGAAVGFPHRWTPGGVTVDADFTGGHLLHLAAAGCVLNDLYREAAALGIEYRVEVSSAAPAGQLAHLLEVVDQVAEIPWAIRAGATVRRVS